MKKGQFLVDFTGKTIDFLKVVQWYGSGNKKANTEWLCNCACGETCVKPRSFLNSKTKTKKTCGSCIQGKTIIGKTLGSFVILHLEKAHRRSAIGFYVGKCVNCGAKKKISKATIQSQTRKRNFTCPHCLVISRRGGGITVGDQKDYLRVVAPIGPKGEGAKRKFLWKVECLYKGPECKGFLEYSSTDFRRSSSCGCKWFDERRTVNGLAAKGHVHHKIYQLRKQINDRCHKKNHHNYPAYGGRGIYVCEEWRTYKGEKGKQSLFAFVDWCLKNGWSEGLHLDRIDNDGPYAPSNCQFIPAIENLFYSSIDNANEEVLNTYIRYYKTWEISLRLIEQEHSDLVHDYKAMMQRWNTRIARRTQELKSILCDH